MKKNVGLIDSYLRITGGLFLLGYGVAKSSTLATLLGSMKVAEGVTRWCPLLYLMKVSTVEEDLSQNQSQNEAKEDVEVAEVQA